MEGNEDRCSQPGHSSWEHYGGRGITVCDRWQEFKNFLADMGERPEGTSLDRIDNEGNYEPGNCRWATAKEQPRIAAQAPLNWDEREQGAKMSPRSPKQAVRSVPRKWLYEAK